ncbi:MAG: PPC domain-containing protein [Opitutales bacterium]
MKFRLLSALLLAPLAAWAAYPDMSALRPHGGQIGTDVKLTITGARLDDFEDLMFYTPGFKVKSVESRAANKVELTLSIDKTVRAGNHVMRVRTKSGVSHMRQFFASPFPNVEEKEPNSEFAGAQPIALNQTVEGVILSEDVDYFKLTVKKGQRIGVQVDGLRLAAIRQGAMDPYVAILDKDRFEKAASDDTILHRQDGYCSFTAEYDGEYYVMVRESSYRGSANSFYRLHVGDFRRPDAIYPAGGKLGTKLTVRFLEPRDSFAEEVSLPAEDDPEFVLYPKSQPPAPSGNLFRLSTVDNTLEAEPNNVAEQGTVAAEAVAYALNGIIGQPGDVDFFRVPLKKGQVFECRALAQTLGSPLDPVVTVLSPKGNSLASNDDGGGMRRLDSRFRLTAPADGVYTVRVTDHLERGGVNFVYRIEMVASQPSLTFASPDYTVNDTSYRQFLAVPKGGRMALRENFTRNGVGGDYRFDLQGLPAGVKLLDDAAPGSLPGVPLVLEAAADAPHGGAVVTPRLLPLDPNNKIVGQMRRTYDIVRIGNVIYYQGIEDQLPVAVVDEAPYSLEIQKPETPLVRNGIFNLKVVAQRKEGFKAPIRVFMVWTPPGVSSLGEQTIPAGATECVFQLSAKADVEAKAWKFVVQGEADAGKGRVYNASPFAELVTEAPYVAANAIPLTAMEVGTPGVMVTNLEVLRPFEGEAVAQLVGAPDTIRIAPIKVTKDTKELRFTVETDGKSRVGKTGNMFVQVDIPTGKGLATHRIALGSTLRLDAPRKAAPAPVAKAAAPAAGKPAAPAAAPAPVVLSRLEQLRLKNEAPKN